MRPIFLFLLAACLASGAAHASTYQPQLALIAQGHPSQAYAELRPKLLASAGNPDFDTAFGLAALDSDAPAEAVTAFERVLAVQPDNLPVRTELARAYEKLGDTAAAARELETVKSRPETPAAVRANISEYANALSEQLSGGPRTLHGTVNVTTGFDSNINTATNSSYLVVPALAALGPARIATGNRGQSSGYSEAAATLTFTQPLTISRALFVSANASQKTPFESSDYSQTIAGTEAGLQVRTPDNGTITAGLSLQQFWFGGDDYSTTTGLAANWQYPLGPATNLTTYGTASHINYARNSMGSANRFVAGATLDSHWQTALAPYTYAGVYGGTEDAATDAFSHNLIGLQFGAELFPTETLSTFLTASYELRRYNADYPLFLKPRADNQLDIATGLNYALTDRIALRPALAYRNASSNIGFYNYTRWLASVGLKYRF